MSNHFEQRFERLPNRYIKPPAASPATMPTPEQREAMETIRRRRAQLTPAQIAQMQSASRMHSAAYIAKHGNQASGQATSEFATAEAKLDAMIATGRVRVFGGATR